MKKKNAANTDIKLAFLNNGRRNWLSMNLVLEDTDYAGKLGLDEFCQTMRTAHEEDAFRTATVFLLDPNDALYVDAKYADAIKEYLGRKLGQVEEGQPNLNS